MFAVWILGFGLGDIEFGVEDLFDNLFPKSDPGLLFKLKAQLTMTCTKIQVQYKFYYKLKLITIIRHNRTVACLTLPLFKCV